MWGFGDNKNEIKRCLRIYSHYFLRKHYLPYIFNSRVKDYRLHIKYRKKILEGIENPERFTCIKEY